MNPPQNINNHFEQPLKSEDIQVSPMCCCYYNFTEESFYKFLNIWDIVFFIISIVTGNIEQMLITILSLVLAIIAFILYCKNGNYGSCLHKVYAIVRLVFIIIDLILIIAFGIMAIISLSKASSHDNGYAVVLIYVIVNLGIFMPILLVSINWSFILKRVVYNKASSGVIANTGNFPNPDNDHQFNPGNSQYVNNNPH